MSISQADAARLREAGFLDLEIEQIANAATAKGEPQPPIQLDSPIWQAVMESRRDWRVDKISRGWTEYEIVSELQNYYRRDSRRSPFDFLRAEYKPPQKKDYMEIVRKRAAAQIARELKGYKL